MRGRCVLMLGPDAVRPTDPNGVPVPILDQLRRHLIEELAEEGTPAPESKRTSAVAQVVVDIKGRDRLIEWVDDFFDDLSVDDPTLRALVKLPFGLIVNTVPGFDLREILGPKFDARSYDRLGSAAVQLPDWSVEQPLLFNLYGARENPDSLVLTDSDLVDVLVSVIRGDPRLPVKLTSAFKDPDLTFIFLGFQLYHWQLRVLLHVLNEGASKPSESFAQEVQRAELDDGARTFYRMRNRIRIVDMDPSHFMSRLVSEIDSDASATLAQIDYTPDSPAVFICHAHEDKEVADDVSKRLRARGINTWLDKYDIPGGSEWNRRIETTLQDEVGYVLVLQSENWIQRRKEQEAYINREITLALKRQELRGPDSVFVVPVFVDRVAAESPDAALKHLQSIPIFDTDGFDSLVRLIKRDVERHIKT
jgi:hypothetical protein